MSLVFLDGYCVTLSSNLTAAASTLPISGGDKADLIEALGTDHSYLVLKGTLGKYEVVKITASDGNVAIQRGDYPIAVSAGKCACFQITMEVLDDYGMKEPCTVTISTETEDWLEITEPEEGSCNWTINVKQDVIDRFEDGLPVDDCSNCTLADGVYENAKITVTNGKICVVANGTNILYTGGSTCCNCSSCSDTE